MIDNDFYVMDLSMSFSGFSFKYLASEVYHTFLDNSIRHSSICYSVFAERVNSCHSQSLYKHANFFVCMYELEEIALVLAIYNHVREAE